MREILFKAKRIDNGDWVKGLLTIMWGQYHIINPNDENTAYPIDTDSLCQYTGLNDKNGNKIWENDIVKQYADCSETGIPLYYFLRVYWDEDYCEYRFDNEYVLGSSEPISEFVDFRDDLEVIGNVFDNPELLERAIKIVKAGGVE